ncbi:MAG: tetratricopeptide repeat protein [Candidatus Heimdallarchaeota archaeon]|nr:tetratricopeptide repeat protein [Candidatus Heimdallarchaeota archaeon]
MGKIKKPTSLKLNRQFIIEKKTEILKIRRKKILGFKMRGAGKIIGHELRKAKFRNAEEAARLKQKESKALAPLNLPGLIDDYCLSGKYGPGEPYNGPQDEFVKKTHDMVLFMGKEILNALINHFAPFPEYAHLPTDITGYAIQGLLVSYRFKNLIAMVTSFPIEKPLNELCLYFRFRLLRPQFVPIPRREMNEEQRRRYEFSRSTLTQSVRYSMEENYNAAVNELLKLIDMYPNNTLLYEHLIVDLHQMQDWDRAIEYTKKLINIFPKSENYWSNIGKAYVRKGDYDNGIDSYKEALKIFPNDKYVLYALGEVYMTLNDKNRAFWCYQRAEMFKHYSAQKAAKKLKRKKAVSISPFD